MTTYKIHANGIDMGAFEGATEREAAESYAQTVGYRDFAALAETIGKTEDEAMGELAFTTDDQ